MRFEPPAHTISFLYQNHQDTPSEIWDLYKSISMPYSQPLFYVRKPVLLVNTQINITKRPYLHLSIRKILSVAQINVPCGTFICDE